MEEIHVLLLVGSWNSWSNPDKRQLSEDASWSAIGNSDLDWIFALSDFDLQIEFGYPRCDRERPGDLIIIMVDQSL